MLKWTWIVTLAAGGINLMIVMLMQVIAAGKEGCNMKYQNRPGCCIMTLRAPRGCDNISIVRDSGIRYERFRVDAGERTDIFLITGGINERINRWYGGFVDACRRWSVAVKVCACNGGILKNAVMCIGGVNTCIIPVVSASMPGCAARPEAIIDGVVKAVALLDKKREERAARKKEEKIQAKQEGGAK